MAILHNGDVAVVLDVQHRTPGNLRAFVQVRMRNLNTGNTFEQRFSAMRMAADYVQICERLAARALPRHRAVRAARVRLAAGAARAGGFISYDISPARVEPHLVAVSQPRSAYCEQFRSLRTRILQAGERMQMHAFVITSAGVAEGKTLTARNLGWL